MINLTRNEQVILEALIEAAEHGAVCPNYLDLNEVAELESSSASPTIVRRLEMKGLIKVERYQRFRVVEIVATGKRTAMSPSMHTFRPHVPRGTRSQQCHTDRKLYRKGL